MESLDKIIEKIGQPNKESTNKEAPENDNELAGRTNNEEQFKNLDVTDRSLKEYRNLLGLSLKQLKGKNILDLGSGYLQSFARDLERRIPETKVTCLDASLKECDAWRRAKLNEKQTEHKSKLVAGSFIKLPFKDASFDIIVSLFGTPFYLSSFVNVKKSLEEIIRVLKSGGEARIFPFQARNCLFLPTEVNKLLDTFKDIDYELLEKHGSFLTTQNNLFAKIIKKLTHAGGGPLLILRKHPKIHKSHVAGFE